VRSRSPSQGAPDDFTVRIGIGKWLEHLGVAAAGTLLISDLFLPVDIAETAWNLGVEDKLVSQVTSFVGWSFGRGPSPAWSDAPDTSEVSRA